MHADGGEGTWMDWACHGQQRWLWAEAGEQLAGSGPVQAAATKYVGRCWGAPPKVAGAATGAATAEPAPTLGEAAGGMQGGHLEAGRL